MFYGGPPAAAAAADAGRGREGKTGEHTYLLYIKPTRGVEGIILWLPWELAATKHPLREDEYEYMLRQVP